MKKVFCDICEKEIPGEYYRVAVANVNSTFKAQWYDMCEKCRKRIFEHKPSLDMAMISKLRREGWTIGRIAEEMGVSPGTIQRRLTS